MNKLIVYKKNELSATEKGKLLILELVATEKKTKEIRQALTDAMTEAVKEANDWGMRKYEDDDIRLNYIDETTKLTFDLVQFKKDYPDVYKEYLKEVATKANVRVTIK